MADVDVLKRNAAEAALKYVKPGMVLGLGTGSTARHFLEGLSRLIGSGMEVKAVPTSFATAEAAKRLGIPLTSLEEHVRLDLCVDGADEVDPKLDLIKGLGGALFREKIVAAASRKFVVIVDDSKLVPRLGTKAPAATRAVGAGLGSGAALRSHRAARVASGRHGLGVGGSRETSQRGATYLRLCLFFSLVGLSGLPLALN